MVTKKQVEEAWERASTIRGKNPDAWRRDEKGNEIRHASYGTTGAFGWEIDHRKPSSKGGTDHGRNLQALHWEANRKKSDKY
jgi:5-methylcytosine-specific restriction endonuclease McrA